MKKTRSKAGGEKGKGLSGYRGKYFDLRIQLFTQEIFHLQDVYNDMKVRAIKAKVEFVTGIPSHLQRLTYLDGGKHGNDKRHPGPQCSVIRPCVWAKISPFSPVVRPWPILVNHIIDPNG